MINCKYEEDVAQDYINTARKLSAAGDIDRAAKTYAKAVVRLMLPVAALSSFLSNTTVVSLFVGIVKMWAFHYLCPLIFFRISEYFHAIQLYFRNSSENHFLNWCDENTLCSQFFQLTNNLPEAFLLEYGVNRAPF